MQQNIKRFNLKQLEHFFEKSNLESYRAKQVFQWLWQKGVRDFNKMTNLSLGLREILAEQFVIEDIKLVDKTTADDGATKFLWQLEDNNYIESVFIPETPRRTVCVSTQVGCPLGCLFCATATMGFRRNLEAFEIANQVQLVQNFSGDKLTNIVFMGMGEPLLNIDNLNSALEIITSPIGLGISQRHITVSTAGIIEGIDYLLKSHWKVKIAISLNFPDQNMREKYMPVARKNPLKEVLQLARSYSLTKHMVTFEYVMIKDLNDSPEHAFILLKLLKPIPSKINLIPYNEYPGLPYKTPDPGIIEEFQKILYNSKHPVTLRKSKGSSILAGCGQLAVRFKDKN